METASSFFKSCLGFLRNLGYRLGCKLTFGQAKHQNAADGVAEEQSHDRDHRQFGFGLCGLQLFQCDKAHDQREDQKELKHHTQNDEHFCCGFHKRSPSLSYSCTMYALITLYHIWTTKVNCLFEPNILLIFCIKFFCKMFKICYNWVTTIKGDNYE